MEGNQFTPRPKRTILDLLSIYLGVAMKAFKIILAVLLAAVTALYCLSAVSTSLSGADVGPSISCGSELLELSISDSEELFLSGVTASDAQDGDLTQKVQVLSVSKFTSDYTAKITYVVFDSDGNMATCTRQLRYTDYTSPVFAITEPLIYAKSASVLLLDRIQVTDCLDGDITESVRVSPMVSTSDPEVYTVDIQVTNSMGDTAQISLPIITQESTLNRAEIDLSAYLVYVSAGSTFDPDDYLRSVTTPAGSGALSNVEISSTVSTATPGTYMVYYDYRDASYTGTSILTVVVQ